jgi:hypothetical protein
MRDPDVTFAVALSALQAAESNSAHEQMLLVGTLTALIVHLKLQDIELPSINEVEEVLNS